MNLETNSVMKGATTEREVVFMAYDTTFNVEEKVAALFQPDSLLPDQYLETTKKKTHPEPEKKLMLGILEDAVACFQKYANARDGKGKTLFREAARWIMEENGDWIFSFEQTCEALELNAQYIREGLMRCKECKRGRDPKSKGYRRSSGRTRKSRVVLSKPTKNRKVTSR
jgi:hypothetical protein